MHFVGYTEHYFITHKVVLPIELVVGILLNIIAIFVWMFGPKSKELCSATYFAANAVTDLLSFTISGLWMYINTFNVNTFDSDVKCKLYGFLRATCLQVSNWISAVITVERALTIMLPFIFRPQGMRKRSKYVLIVITVFFLIINIKPLIILEKCANKSACCSIPNVNTDILATIESSIRILVPLFMIVIFNCATVVTLCKNQFHNSSATSNRQNYVNVFTQLAILTGVSFIVSNTLDIIRTMVTVFKLDLSESFERAFYILIDWSNVLYYLNGVMNPIICFAVCKCMREDLQAAVKHLVLNWVCWRCRTQNQEESATQRSTLDLSDTLYNSTTQNSELSLSYNTKQLAAKPVTTPDVQP